MDKQLEMFCKYFNELSFKAYKDETEILNFMDKAVMDNSDSKFRFKHRFMFHIDTDKASYDGFKNGKFVLIVQETNYRNGKTIYTTFIIPKENEFGTSPFSPGLTIVRYNDDEYKIFNEIHQDVNIDFTKIFIEDIPKFKKILNDKVGNMDNFINAIESRDIFDPDSKFREEMKYLGAPYVSERYNDLVEDLGSLMSVYIEGFGQPLMRTVCEAYDGDLVLLNKNDITGCVVNKEKEDIPESPTVWVKEEGEVKTDEEIKGDKEEMTKQIKEANKKKEFWDDREIFTMKNKKLRKVINRIYTILNHGEGLGMFDLDLVYDVKPGNDLFTNDNFSPKWTKSGTSKNSLSMYLSKVKYSECEEDTTYNYGVSFILGEPEENKKSKYLIMNIYEMTENFSMVKVLVSITFNITNNYYYYTIRDHAAQFTFLSRYIDPALIFYYNENELLAHFMKVMIKDYDFNEVLDLAEDTYAKVKAFDKAKKQVKKEEKKRKKQEAKEAKKASKKEKKASKDSKEDK